MRKKDNFFIKEAQNIEEKPLQCKSSPEDALNHLVDADWSRKASSSVKKALHKRITVNGKFAFRGARSSSSYLLY